MEIFGVSAREVFGGIVVGGGSQGSILCPRKRGFERFCRGVGSVWVRVWVSDSVWGVGQVVGIGAVWVLVGIVDWVVVV